MKTYTVHLTAKGGGWLGMRRKYTLDIEAENKAEAMKIGLDTIMAEITDADSFLCTKVTVAKPLTP